MRILPRPQREAMFEIYSFCRAVDDIADDRRPRDLRRAQLQQWRGDIDAIYRGARAAAARRPGAGGARIRPAARGFPRRHRRHGDGCGRRYPRAGPRHARPLLRPRRERGRAAVGARVRHGRRTTGIALAHHLGRALQLTNILRDLDEDAAHRPALSAARGAAGGRHRRAPIPAVVLARPALARSLRRWSSPCAEAHFARPTAIMARTPRRAVRAPRIMGEVYRAILDALDRARLGAAARARARCRVRSSSGSSCATRSF